MKAKVLFLCTGNYYRSRFAEILFNQRASDRGIDWVADSRGLATELGVNNIGPISTYAVAGLQERAIPVEPEMRFPRQVEEADLQEASLIIALDRTEHQPYVEQRLAGWVDRIHYWDVADLHLMSATEALTHIEIQIEALLDRCVLSS
jgi:protein-tyrosine phosphatase